MCVARHEGVWVRGCGSTGGNEMESCAVGRRIRRGVLVCLSEAAMQCALQESASQISNKNRCASDEHKHNTTAKHMTVCLQLWVQVGTRLHQHCYECMYVAGVVSTAKDSERGSADCRGLARNPFKNRGCGCTRMHVHLSKRCTLVPSHLHLGIFEASKPPALQPAWHFRERRFVG